MKNTTKTLSTLLLLTLSLAACDLSLTSDDRTINGGPGSGLKCESDRDCGGGLECEIEEEHGEVWSYCKPHGGGHGSGSGSGSGGTPGTFECQTDADCGRGLECEIEEEHGESWSYCKPHGGN